MKRTVFGCGGSYSTESIWYDTEKDEFFLDMYEWGSVDDEERFEGTEPITSRDALKKAITYDRLPAVIKFYDELHVARDLDEVLDEMHQSGWVYKFGMMEERDKKYYTITEDEYAIFFSGTYYSVKDGEGVVDFSVVKRILENRETVIRHSYEWSSGWKSSHL